MQTRPQRLYAVTAHFQPDPQQRHRDHHLHHFAWHRDQEVMWALGVHPTQLSGMSGTYSSFEAYNGPFEHEFYLPAAPPEQRTTILIGNDLTDHISGRLEDAATLDASTVANTAAQAGIQYGRFSARLSASLAQQPESIQRHVSEQVCLHRDIQLRQSLFSPRPELTKEQLRAVLDWTLRELLPPAVLDAFEASGHEWKAAFLNAERRGASQCVLPVPDIEQPGTHPSKLKTPNTPGTSGQAQRQLPEAQNAGTA